MEDVKTALPYNISRVAKATAEGDESSNKGHCQHSEQISRPFMAKAPTLPEIQGQVVFMAVTAATRTILLGCVYQSIDPFKRPVLTR